MKILCVGKNYAAHAKEMGGATPGAPVWFWKPESAMVGDGGAIVLPPECTDVHHEVELAVRIGKQAHRTASPEDALACVDAFTVAIDVTARDLQQAAKQQGLPWAQAKGFDTFLPLGAWVPCDGVDLQALTLHLSVDGDVRQEGTTAAMTWSVADLVHLASQWTTLEPGDVLLTGTPEGVGPLRAGQSVEAHAGEAHLRVDVRKQ